MTKFTGRTLSSWERLSDELEAVRCMRYAMDLEENECGVRCVAAPMLDGLRGSVAAISISGPKVRLEDNRLTQLAKHAVAAAKRLGSYSMLEAS